MKISDFGRYCGNPLYDWDLSDKYVTLGYEYELHSGYLKEYNPDNWLDCPACRQKPRIWEFDNGRSAACMCYTNYEEKVGATPIGRYIRANNGSALDFPSFELRDNWNDRCNLLSKFINRKKTLNNLIVKL